MRIDCEQYSREWWLARKGRLTASDAKTIMVAGVGLETLAWEKAAEKIMTDEQYMAVLERRRSNIVLDFASAQENFSRDWLASKLGRYIDGGGIEIFDDNTAFSADGFIDGMGGLEIKNHEPKIALRMFYRIINGLRNGLSWDNVMDPEHYAQIQFALWKMPEMNSWTFAIGSDCWGDAMRFWQIPRDTSCHEQIAAGVVKGNKMIENIVIELLKLDNEYKGNKNDSPGNT